MNACVLRRKFKLSTYSFPGGILKYIAMCHEIKKEVKISNGEQNTSKLPFMSSVLGEMTLNSPTFGHLSYLKY